MTLELLREQQASLQQELEDGRAQFYRAEGALTLVKHLISILEAAQTTQTEIESSGQG